MRLEYGETRPDDTPSSNRYTRAAATLRDWLQSGVLVRDDAPALYVDDQQFSHEGRLLTRRSLFARVRLHDWDEGPIRPHERTLNRPKEDRIQLLRACRVNISPILSLYRDDDAKVRDAVESAMRAAPLLATAETNGERHSLRRLDDDAALETHREPPVGTRRSTSSTATIATRRPSPTETSGARRRRRGRAKSRRTSSSWRS